MVLQIIAFFGPDGSGKSTYAELLANHLQSHGMKVRKVWMRSPHTFAFLLSRFLVKIGFYRLVLNPFGEGKKIPAVHVNRKFRLFWSITELVSVIPVVILRVYIPLLLGYVVVAERCIVDTIVNIAYYTNDASFLQSRTVRLLLNLFPRKALLIHLDSDYLTLMKRRGRTVEAYSLINFQRNCYRAIEKLLNAAYVNTSNHDVNQTSKLIIRLVKEKMRISDTL
jgi:energy-coupling factor transporter ATP-binding protein EcfA2